MTIGFQIYVVFCGSARKKFENHWHKPSGVKLQCQGICVSCGTSVTLVYKGQGAKVAVYLWRMLTRDATKSRYSRTCFHYLAVYSIIIPLLFSPITPSVSNPVNNYMCTFYSAPIWTNHISHHIHTSDNNPIGFINSLRIWLKVHIFFFFRSLLPVISLKIDLTWLGIIQM